jgi:Ser-tRNA(Ala) deacylase AlaX
MVDIPGYAITFCFGTHVRSTGEIGLLTELRLSKAKKGRKIIHFFLE